MPRTVLLVDEDAAALADLRRTLHESTYRVLSARGARPAFEVLAVEPVHVIVSGSTLSETTGIEFLARVRLRHPNTVRIVLVAEADGDAARQAIERGTVHFALSRAGARTGGRTGGADDLVQTIGRGLEQLDLLNEAQRLLRAARRQTGERQGCSPLRPR